MSWSDNCGWFCDRENHILNRDDVHFSVRDIFRVLKMIHDSLVQIVVPEYDGENQFVLFGVCVEVALSTLRQKQIYWREVIPWLPFGNVWCF